MIKLLTVEQFSPYYIIVQSETPDELAKRNTKLCELGGIFRETISNKNGDMRPAWLFLKHKEKNVIAYVDWINHHHNERLREEAMQPKLHY